VQGGLKASLLINKEDDMKEKELIWVSKDLADEYKALDSEQLQELMVRNIISAKKIDIEDELNGLDETVLRFKAACLIHKNALQKVYHEQANQLYALWEDMGDIESKIKKHATEIADKAKAASCQIEVMSGNVSNLKKAVDGLAIYNLDRLTDLVEKVAHMDKATKEIFTFLVKNYEAKA